MSSSSDNTGAPQTPQDVGAFISPFLKSMEIRNEGSKGITELVEKNRTQRLGIWRNNMIEFLDSLKKLPPDLEAQRDGFMLEIGTYGNNNTALENVLFQSEKWGEEIVRGFQEKLTDAPPGNREQETERGKLINLARKVNIRDRKQNAGESADAGQLEEGTDRLLKDIADFRQKRQALEDQADEIIREAKSIDRHGLDDELSLRVGLIVTGAKRALNDSEATSFDFGPLRLALEGLKGDVAAVRAEQELARRIAAVKQEGERIGLEALEAVQEGDSDPLRQRAIKLNGEILEDLEQSPKDADTYWSTFLDGLRRDVAKERAERQAKVRKRFEDAITFIDLQKLDGIEELARGLFLDAEIRQAREEVNRLIGQNARLQSAGGPVDQADAAARSKNTALAAAGDSRRTFAQRHDAAKAAQVASAKERELLQQALAILDPAEDWEFFDPLDARLRGLKDYADLVASTHAAYLRQLEIERKEGLARKLRAGEVPLGAAPEPAEAPKPLWDETQEKAAHEMARFMREEPLWYDVYEKWKLHWRRCVNGHRFLEIDNVGSWACRQHALPFDQRAQRFPCCDKAELDPGCVRADHRVTEAPLTEAHNISGVKDLILRAMEGDRPGRAPPGDFVRFDRAEHARRARPVIHWKERPSSKTVSVLLPDFLTLERDPADENRVLGGAAAAPADMWLWDWAAPRPETTAPPAGAPVSARIIYLDQLSEFIYNQTKDTVTFKVALLVEDVPVLFQHGRRGVPYRTHPHRPLEFTPLERVRLWASSPR